MDGSARDSGIVELPAGAPLPPRRDRVVITYAGTAHVRDRTAGGRGARPPGYVLPTDMGVIVDDRLDGRKVYPLPPRHVRDVDRLRRATERFSVAMLPFVALALLHGAIALAAFDAGRWAPASIALLASRVGYVVAIGLVPAGVLIWRRDAWKTAPLLFYGAVAWTSLPALADAAWWTSVHLSDLGRGDPAPASLLVAGATFPAALGPMAMAFGLARFRREPDPWLGALAREATLFALMVALFNAGRWLAPGDPGTSISGAGTYISGVFVVPVPAPRPFGPAIGLVGAVAPIAFAGLVLLAVSTASAAYFREPQRRLWQLAAAGSALVSTVVLYEACTDELPGGLGLVMAAPARVDAFLLLATAGLLAGAVCMLGALTSPVWSLVPDATDSSLGAPEEVFAWGSAVRPIWARPTPMNGVVCAAAGADHALAADQHGMVAAWGDNSLGQTDVPAGLSGVVAVAAGDGFSLALRADGHVVGWGADDRGQSSPPWGLAGVKAIAAGGAFGLALRGDGTLVGWGDDADGSLEIPNLRGVTAISAGRRHALALLADGTVVAWGDGDLGQTALPGGLGSVRAIAAGGDFSLAIRADGTVAAWGDGRYGQLDVPAGLADVVAVAAGAYHAVALRVGGDVLGWGGGGLAHGESDHPWRLVDFKAVAAGTGFTLGIRAAPSRFRAA